MQSTFFDKEISRRGTASAKWDSLPKTDENTLSYIPLNVADMDFAVPPAVSEALQEVVDRKIYGYSSAQVEPRFMESCIWWLKQRFNLEVEQEAIVSGNGSMNMINAAIEGFSNVGDGVILQYPVYGTFTRAFTQQCHRKIASARLLCDEDGRYKMDFDALEEACAEPLNKIMVLCSPHNPVGRVWRQDELEKVLEICRKHDVLLISDEIHCDLLRQGEKHIPIVSLANEDDRVIQVFSISKSFNCAGLKSSNAIILNPRLREQFKTVMKKGGLSPFAIEAVIAAYSEAGEEWLEALKSYLDENIKLVRAYFAEQMPEVKITDPEGTYLLWFDFNPTGLSHEEIHRIIYDEAHVFLQDGTVHDPEKGQGFQRMTTSCPRSVLQEACTRIVKAFSESEAYKK